MAVSVISISSLDVLSSSSLFCGADTDTPGSSSEDVASLSEAASLMLSFDMAGGSTID